MNNHLARLTLATTSLIVAAALVACGGGGGSGGTVPPPNPMPANGTISASITDAPACGFDEVNVTVLKVRVHKSATAGETESGWFDITPATPKKINLLNLTNGVVDVLGEASVPAGTYTQVRLVLDANAVGVANTVLPTGGSVTTLDTPSAVQSGLKLNGSFNVVAGAKTDIVIDFDACKSILTKGNGKYALKPVLKLIPAGLNGISGFVSTTLMAPNVKVSAQQNGVVVASSVPSAGGEFKLTRLAPGNYDVVITADGNAASVVGAVPVASTSSMTVLSTATMPIVLTSAVNHDISGTVVLSTVVVATEAAYVAARQSFSAGPTVTIKYAGADLLTGAYTIGRLPVVAPQYAVYGASLPLVFAPVTLTQGAGKYSVDASAAGYVTRTFATPVDISGASAVNVNFALMP